MTPNWKYGAWNNDGSWNHELSLKVNMFYDQAQDLSKGVSDADSYYGGRDRRRSRKSKKSGKYYKKSKKSKKSRR